MSSALSSPVDQTSAYVAGGAVPTGMGNARPSPFPYEPLRTGDGELIVVVGDDGRFRRLADLPGTRRSVPARRTRSLTVDGAEC
ncbi:hypothetical protein ACGF3G_27620 [Streptomyces sp. NPDC048179]|uniref:hypothetical protein n=1 Tax=Streptomyces sp. NPDC048179 TaxID=3365506 RepID=UPI0037145660